MKYFSSLMILIFSLLTIPQNYPDMPEIPEELKGKLPMSGKMFGMQEEEEFESIEEFL